MKQAEQAISMARALGNLADGLTAKPNPDGDCLSLVDMLLAGCESAKLQLKTKKRKELEENPIVVKMNGYAATPRYDDDYYEVEIVVRKIEFGDVEK